MSQDEVEEQDHHAAHHHGARRGGAHLERVAAGVVAVEGRDRGDDVGEEDGLDERVGDRIGAEVHEQAVDVLRRDHDARRSGDEPPAEDADQDREDRQKRKEDHRGDDLRQDEVRRRVDAHDLEGVDLLGDAHGADLGGDARPDLSGEDQRHDGRRELQDHRLARGVADERAGDERRVEVDAHLQGDDRADEGRDEGRQADRVDAEGLHLVDDAAAVDRGLLRTGKDLSHQDEVAADE